RCAAPDPRDRSRDRSRARRAARQLEVAPGRSVDRSDLARPRRRCQRSARYDLRGPSRRLPRAPHARRALAMKLFTFTLMLAALMACGSCTDKSEKTEGAGSSVTHVTEPSDAIDQKLMVALSQAKNFHHKAKVYMSDGN